MSSFELWWPEIGKTYTMTESIRIATPFGTILLPQGYKHDGDTGVINFQERIPSVDPMVVPAAHDWGFDYEIDELGRVLSFQTWNKIYYYLSRHSNSWARRRVARLRYWVVSSWVGRRYWDRSPDAMPLPAEWAPMFGDSLDAFALRMKMPVLAVNDQTKRLQLLPPQDAYGYDLKTLNGVGREGV